jgi:UDP-glucose 4-epimerase
MKYLVTGGAGFIGSNLVDELIARGHQVRVIDNLETGLRANVNPRAEFFELDIRNLEAIKPLFVGVDGVFHLAALPRVIRSIQDPRGTHEVTVLGTLYVLIASRDACVKRLVYSASASAYGDQKVLPVREDAKPAPLNPYGLQKWMGEEYCKLFKNLYGLETVSLRYFNVYGPRMLLDGAYATVIGIFIKQCQSSEPLSIFGNGRQTRDFTHVQDVVRANILAMESPRVGQAEVINIGASQPISVNEVARLLGGEVGYLPARLGEIMHSRADWSRAKEFLEWKPLVSFEEGLAELKKIHGLM